MTNQHRIIHRWDVGVALALAPACRPGRLWAPGQSAGGLRRSSAVFGAPTRRLDSCSRS